MVSTLVVYTREASKARHVIVLLAGARVLRQDPVECLFEFVCSSNNHISRIHGMVERLCRAYGTPLLCQATPTSPALPSTSVAPVAQRLSDGSFKASLREVSVQKLEAAQDGVNQMVALQSSEAGRASQEEQAVPDLACYSFPTLQQLSQATEAALRAEGFGYRYNFCNFFCELYTLATKTRSTSPV